MFVWWGPEFIQLYNDGYIPMLGSRHPRALGRRGPDVWSDIWDVVGPLAHRVLTEGVGTWNERLLLIMQRHGYTEESYFTFSYSPAYDDEGAIGGVFCVVAEETERVLSERRMAALAALAATTAGSDSGRQACERAATALERFAHDLPFALLFLDTDTTKTSLVAVANSPRTGEHEGERRPEHDWTRVPWPFEAAARSGWEVVDDLPAHGLTVPAGPWPEPVRTAVVVPLSATERTSANAFLVAAVSPRRPLDAEYRRFIELVASQLGKALADARQVEHERQRARELAELDRAKTVFFSNISHEFRTPLTLILGPLEEAAQRASSDAGTRELLLAARSNAQRLLRLVNALLDFARIESGRINARFAATDLCALTADLASTFRSVCERAGLVLEVDCESLPEPVFVDPELWEKIVLNLLSNAFKFTFEGRITVRVRAAGARAELVVEDTGVGIADANLSRIFRRFERVEGARGRNHEGSGIGLSLVAELVQVHGGTVTVESELGRGSRFVVTVPFGFAHLPADAVVRDADAVELLPAAARAEPYVGEASKWLDAQLSARNDRSRDVRREPGQPSSGPPSTDPSAPIALSPTSHHVLVVDDNADMRRYVERILSPPHRVTLAHDGNDAWARILESPPDLVVTDIMMPGLDGFGLIAKIRADERTRVIPVIALSARAGEESRVDGLSSGADDYLVKPFTARELAARVHAQLRLADAARERSRLLAREQTARKEAEYQRRNLRAIFEQAPTLMAVFRGAEHVVELANTLICQAWGRRQEDVLGRPFLDAVPEGRTQAWRELLDAVYRTGEPCAGREMEAWFERNGKLETSYYDFVYAPLRQDGVVDGIIVVATDVTAQVHARRQVDELREAAESASRAKDEFLAMLGHELRNPLAPIATALELLKMRGIEAVEAERAIIERQMRHVVTLVDDLLDVSRITRGKVELKRTFVELADVVGKAIEMASPLLEQQMHDLRVDVPLSGLSVLGDANRLAQVVANIVNNAAKYTEPGGKIEISACLEDGQVTLRVRDSGVGIAPDMLPHVFDLFVQERQSSERARGGLGLGLTIVRSLVLLHGGTVTAESAGSGRGSTFTIRLPHTPLPGAGELSAPSHDGRLDSGVASRLRVLIVDDNVDAAEMLAQLLMHFGCAVHVVHDGPAALDAAVKFQPDIALLDIGLPVMDGYELARRLREHPLLANVRLVAVTGYGQRKDRERSEHAGFDDHLVKPLDMTQLRQTLTRLAPRTAYLADGLGAAT